MSSNPTDTIYVGNSQPKPSQEQKASVELPDFPKNNDSPIPNFGPTPLPQGFFQIIDISTEWQRGNFLPALHCLRYNLMPKDFFDQTGYNVLHHAVSQGSIPTVLTLLDYFKYDVNLRSQNNQTPLMIACNYGHIEIIRLLIERGAQVNATDATGFSPLLYSVKQGFLPQSVYLLHHKADPKIHDSNGCTVVHWAAYKNNVFMLELFKRLGFDLNCTDATGLTPLDRALQGDAYPVVKYLLENGDGKMPSKMEYDKVLNPDCKELLRKHYFPTKFETLQKEYWGIFTKQSQKITFGVYAFLWFFMMTIYLKAAMNNVSGDIYQMMFFLFSIYFIAYSFWYFLKSAQLKTKVAGYQKLNKTSDNLDDIISSINDTRNSAPRLNSDALDRLVKGDSHGTVIHEVESDEPTSFLHELAWNFETKNYKEIGRFKENDYCPRCLQKKPERGSHPENSGTCVPHFHHYSYTLGRSIDRNNHYLYLFLMLSQGFMFRIFFNSLLDAYSAKLEHSFLIGLLEVGYKFSEDIGLVYSWIYMLLLTLAGFNFVFLCIEFFGVLKNLTYYEMFNVNSCSYLWEVRRDRRDPELNVFYFTNPNDLGMLSNIKEYFKRIIH